MNPHEKLLEETYQRLHALTGGDRSFVVWVGEEHPGHMTLLNAIVGQVTRASRQEWPLEIYDPLLGMLEAYTRFLHALWSMREVTIRLDGRPGSPWNN